MENENTSNRTPENLSDLNEFLEKSTRLEQRLRDTLNDVREVRTELEGFLSLVSDLRLQGIRELTGSGGGASVSGSRPETASAGRQTDEDAGETEEETETIPDGPIRAGDFTVGEEYSRSDTDNGGDFSPSSAETDSSMSPGKTGGGDENSMSYRRRMIQKDPRLKDLPESVHETLASARELMQEAERGIQFLDSLSVKSRSAQIAIWAGRARQIQDELEEYKESIPSEFFQKMHVFFGKLTTVTRDAECEWIDALKRSYSTDWDRYLEEQERKLNLSLQREKRAREFLKEPPKERKKDRKICRRRLRELANKEDPDHAEVKSALTEGMDLLALDDPAVTEVALRFSDIIEEDEKFEPIREAIKGKAKSREPKEESSEQMEVHPRPTFGPNIGEEILTHTRDRRVAAIGDQVTKEWQRRIEDAFEFETLTWVDVNGEDTDFEETVRKENLDNYDYLLLMKSRLENRFSKASQICDTLSAETVVVEEGVGIAPIRDALRKRFLKPETT